MKSTRTHNSAGPGQMSIPEAEEIVEEALSELAFSSDPGLSRAIRFLAPPGYQAIVELCGENGRSKRRNAAADSWSPDEDEVRIYFERVEGADAPHPYHALRDDLNHGGVQGPNLDGHHGFDRGAGRDEADGADFGERVKELCAALAEAERGGHAFIALKWFRDSFLPRKAFRWNQHPESRQAVLAEAIQRGVVVTSKIANPKTPAYPTTTIRLQRAEAGMAEETQRLNPVPMQADFLPGAMEEERGVD